MFFFRVFVTLFFCSSLVFANFYQDMEKVDLKKDEQKKILVKYDDIEKIFIFRWTLYVNDGLVVLSSYDDIVSQRVLYLNHKNQSFRVELKSKGADKYSNVPYILVKFLEFDYEKKIAKFQLLLSDKEMQIKVDYL